MSYFEAEVLLELDRELRKLRDELARTNRALELCLFVVCVCSLISAVALGVIVARG